MAGFSWNLLVHDTVAAVALTYPIRTGLSLPIDPSPAYSYKRVTEY